MCRLQYACVQTPDIFFHTDFNVKQCEVLHTWFSWMWFEIHILFNVLKLICIYLFILFSNYLFCQPAVKLIGMGCQSGILSVFPLCSFIITLSLTRLKGRDNMVFRSWCVIEQKRGNRCGGPRGSHNPPPPLWPVADRSSMKSRYRSSLYHF